MCTGSKRPLWVLPCMFSCMFSCPFQLLFQAEAKERSFISICPRSGTELGSLFPLSTLTLIVIPGGGDGEISQNLHFYRRWIQRYPEVYPGQVHGLLPICVIRRQMGEIMETCPDTSGNKEKGTIWRVLKVRRKDMCAIMPGMWRTTILYKWLPL